MCVGFLLGQKWTKPADSCVHDKHTELNLHLNRERLVSLNCSGNMSEKFPCYMASQFP